MVVWSKSWRIYFNFPFQFYQSFSSISYIEIGVKLNLSQIFVMKLMSGCGKGKYLTKICWKLSIFDSKALISCIFPKNVTHFCDFLENTCMYHVYNQKYSSQRLEIGLQMSIVCQENDIFYVPKRFDFIFSVKNTVLNWFPHFRFRTYIYTTITVKKLPIKGFNNTKNQSWSFLFVTGKSAAPCTTHKKAPRETQYILYRQFQTDFII